MLLRRVLSGLSLVAVVGAAALIPTTASATEATLSVTGKAVAFDSGTTATITVDYTCGSAESSSEDVLGITVYQPLADDKYQAAADGPADGTAVTCDGSEHSTGAIPLEVTEGTFHNGAAQASMIIGDDEDATVYQKVTVSGVPKGLLALTAKAPSSAKKGAKITVTGTATRDKKAVKKLKVTLYFAAVGADEYTAVTKVKSSSKGKLSVKVKATKSGYYAFGYDSDAESVISTGAKVKVK